MVDVDYTGDFYTMESFTGTTDGSGDLVVNLANTPTDDVSIIVFCTTALTVVEFVSRATAAITLRFRNLKYDKTDVGGVGVGSAQNPPSSVNLITASTHNTNTVAAVAQDNESTGSPKQTPAHSHTINSMFQHDHTFTVTNIPIVNTGAVAVTIGYAY